MNPKFICRILTPLTEEGLSWVLRGRFEAVPEWCLKLSLYAFRPSPLGNRVTILIFLILEEDRRERVSLGRLKTRQYIV